MVSPQHNQRRELIGSRQYGAGQTLAPRPKQITEIINNQIITNMNRKYEDACVALAFDISKREREYLLPNICEVLADMGDKPSFNGLIAGIEIETSLALSVRYSAHTEEARDLDPALGLQYLVVSVRAAEKTADTSKSSREVCATRRMEVSKVPNEAGIRSFVEAVVRDVIRNEYYDALLGGRYLLTREAREAWYTALASDIESDDPIDEDERRFFVSTGRFLFT